MRDIGKEYALALFVLALEKDEARDELTALETVASILREDETALEFLSSPAVPLTARTELLDKAFGKTVPEYVLSFLKLLCEKGRMGLYFDCVEEFSRLLKVKESLATAKVTSAVPLTEEEKAALKLKLEKISKNTVELVCTVDPSILGGIVVEMGDTVIDGSVAGRLALVKDVIT